MGAPEEAKTAAKKIRRVKSGKDFWGMYDIVEELDEAQKKYSDFCRELARTHGLYLDQIKNLVTGLIIDDEGKKQRAPDKFIKAIANAPERHNIITVGEKLDKEINRVARKYKVWPDVLDPRTGVIDDDFVVSVGADDKPEAPAEPETPEADK